MSDISQEKIFQNDILKQMQTHGWLLGESNKYNRELALYPEDVIAFVKKTQSEQWDKLAQHFPNTDRNPTATADALLKSIEQELKSEGTLWVLRNKIRLFVKSCGFGQIMLVHSTLFLVQFTRIKIQFSNSFMQLRALRPLNPDESYTLDS